MKTTSLTYSIICHSLCSFHAYTAVISVIAWYPYGHAIINRFEKDTDKINILMVWFRKVKQILDDSSCQRKASAGNYARNMTIFRKDVQFAPR